MIAEASRLAATQKVSQLTPAMIEGFAAAKVLVAGLRRAEKENKVITRQSLKRGLQFLGVTHLLHQLFQLLRGGGERLRRTRFVAGLHLFGGGF